MLNLALVTLGDPGQLTGGYMYHVRVAERAPSHGARIRFVSFPGWPFPLPALAGWSVLRQLQGADAVLLDSIAAAFFAPWMSLRSPRVPVLGILHQPPGGIDHAGPRQAVQRWLDQAAYRQCSRLLVASHDLADEVRATGFATAPLQVVCPGSDVADEAQAVAEDMRRGRQAALLCVGNWVHRKDILTLIHAFATLPDDAATLHLVGDENVEPHYAERIRARLAQDDVARRVVRHGKRTRSEVAGMYEAADAFVLASLKEPYGTVYGEAMARGLPVAGWRAGNLPHLAENEREGLLAEPGDVAGLAEAMRRLSCDSSLRDRMSVAARERARSFATWDQTTRDIVQAVRQVLEDGGRPCPIGRAT